MRPRVVPSGPADRAADGQRGEEENESDDVLISHLGRFEEGKQSFGFER